jgi:hypothetical protein
MKKLSTIGRDEKGISITEFALVVPVMTMFLVGIVDLSIGFAAKLALNQAVTQGLQLAQIAAENGSPDVSAIKTRTAQAAKGNENKVNVVPKLICGTQEKAYSESCGANESIRRFVEIEVAVEFKPIFGNYAGAVPVNANGMVEMKSSGSVRVQ